MSQSADQTLLHRGGRIVEMYRAGQTYQEIGDRFGVSRERVRQIIAEVEPSLLGQGIRIRREAREAQKLARRRAFSRPCVVCGNEVLRFRPGAPSRELARTCSTACARQDHGYYHTYNHYGCRCQPCRDASRARLYAWKARVKGNPPRHGVASSYANYSCRCGPCTEANTEKCRQYDRRRRLEREAS